MTKRMLLIALSAMSLWGQQAVTLNLSVVRAPSRVTVTRQGNSFTATMSVTENGRAFSGTMSMSLINNSFRSATERGNPTGNTFASTLLLDPVAMFLVTAETKDPTRVFVNLGNDQRNAQSLCLAGANSANPPDVTCPINSLSTWLEEGVKLAGREIEFRVAAESVNIRFGFTYEPPTDSISLLASLPESGKPLEVGTSPPFLARVVYQVGTVPSAEVFLELKFLDPVLSLPAGYVISYSNSRRVTQGLGAIGSGEGNDGFLSIDPVDLPETASPYRVQLQAWLGESGGGRRLVGSLPVVFPVEPPGKLTLDIGYREDSGFRTVNPSEIVLLSGHRIQYVHPGLTLRATSFKHELSEDRVSFTTMHVVNGLVVYSGTNGPDFLEDRRAYSLVEWRGYATPCPSMAYRATLRTESGQKLVSNLVELSTECPLVKAIAPNTSQTLERGSPVSFQNTVELHVVRRDQRLLRCVYAPDAVPYACEELTRVAPGKINYHDTFTFNIPPLSSLGPKSLLIHYAIAPDIGAADKEHARSDFGAYQLKDPPSLVEAGVGRVLGFANGAIEKIRTTSNRIVNVEGPRVKTGIWAADTYKVIFGKDPAGGKSRGAATQPADVLGLRTAWLFDPPIPQDGSFSGEMTLRYSPDDFPDDPNFEESKLEILAINPATGEIDRVAGRVDVVARTVTAQIDRLAPVYTLGSVNGRTKGNFNLPAIGAKGGRQSGVVLVNPGAETLSAQLKAFAGGVETQVEREIRPRAQLSAMAGELFNSVGESDWIQVRAQGTQLAGLQLLSIGTAMDAVPLAASPARFSALPHVEWNGSGNTELHVTNSGNFETQFTVYLYARDGSEVGRAWETLAPKSEFKGEVSGMFPDVAEPFVGHLQISSEEPVTVTAVFRFAASIAVSTAQTLTGSEIDATRLYAPLAGGGVTLYVVNKGGETARLTLRAWRDTGAAMGSPVTVELPSGRLYSADLGTLFALEAGASGWLQVESNRGGIVGEICFGDAFAARFRGSLPLSRELSRIGVIPLAMHNSVAQTTLVISSPGAASNVRVTVVSPNGTTIGTGTVTVPANGRVANPLPQWVSQAANLAGGSILIDASQPVTGYALLAPVAGTDYAAIPFFNAVIPGGSGGGTARPSIEVAPTRLDFGNVTPGQNRDLTLQVRNTGTAALSVSSIRSSDARFTLVRPAAPFNVAAGAVENLTVRFTPGGAGAQTGTLTINSNDPAQAALNVAMSGTGAQSLREVTLAVDDGTYEQGVGVAAGAPLIYFLNRLTPPSYPATLKRIIIFFGSEADELPQGHPITVLAETHPGGAVGINGTSFQRLNSTVGARGRANEYTLTTPITISSGDFVVGFSTSNPARFYPMAIDTTTTRRASYISTTGTAFNLVDTVGIPGNFAIRAVVDVPQ
ncbi:MAG: choice-of-anchor D domain-containing protein [Candidatus Solibacter usitatus]|nr:choice-of-anchor D domain-containing protein [Candidatus Solibacter usitatus]